MQQVLAKHLSTASEWVGVLQVSSWRVHLLQLLAPQKTLHHLLIDIIVKGALERSLSLALFGRGAFQPVECHCSR